MFALIAKVILFVQRTKTNKFSVMLGGRLGISPLGIRRQVRAHLVLIGKIPMCRATNSLLFLSVVLYLSLEVDGMVYVGMVGTQRVWKCCFVFVAELRVCECKGKHSYPGWKFRYIAFGITYNSIEIGLLSKMEGVPVHGFVK